MIAVRGIVAVAGAALVAGCGSASVSELPPAAGPARTSVAVGDHRAVLLGRERVVELVDPRTGRQIARAAAGVGPTHVAAAGDRLYVTDTRGDALLVFTTRPELELVRRVYLPGGPSAIRLDARRRLLWVALTARDEVVGLPATGRPHPVARRRAYSGEVG